MRRFYLLPLIFMLLVFSSLESVSLLSLQSKSKKGDYFAALSLNEILFYAVLQNSPDTLIIQLASAPKAFLKERPNWKVWAEKGASCATLNALIAIDKKKGSVLWVYDLQKQALRGFNEGNLITTLLHLSLREQEPAKRKKKYLDRKSGPNYWSPAVRFQGKQYPNTHLTPWEAEWPNDGTELSRQKIVVYLSTEDKQFPAYIPYLIEVGTGGTKQALRTLDSGTNYSPPFCIPPIFIY